MALDFRIFKRAVAAQFENLAKHQLFRTSISKDEMWETYLGSFPDGTNPIYCKRPEYDCNCCKHFIRAVGDVVAIIDGRVVSLWDCAVDDVNYQTVANAMAKVVKAHPIENVFVHFEHKAGTDKTLINTLEGVKSWQHFYVNLPRGCVMPGKDIASFLGKKKANFDVMLRGLLTISEDAVSTVLELIAQNSLYRGEEHKPSILEFKKLMAQFKKLNLNKDRSTFVWANLKPQGMIRNTVIGTLLTDLSEGYDLEDAVKSFELKVAPQNYKRPTALVTKSMIEGAKKTINELGLSSALERRYAVAEDITVDNVLFANRNTRRSMKGDVFDELASKVPTKTLKLEKVEDVPIEIFVNNFLPQVDSIELLVENRHASNLVSLIAPVDPTAKRLFKWDNSFSWSYNGEVTDSIKERVKRAGGSVVGDLCCRLAWDYPDDLDLHMFEPNGYKIFFSNRRRLSPCGGMLDIDANGVDGQVSDPVENIYYGNKSKMSEGLYKLVVHNYNRRSNGRGFEVEIEFEGSKFHMTFEPVLANNVMVTVAVILYSKAKGFEIIESLPSSQVSKEIWGLTTHTYSQVDMLMLSPNYWDNKASGNKHWFFMLNGCRNDGQARGFFNEFLTEELTAHRKVIEMVGAKMLTEQSERQLSGLGFSSTQRNRVTCRVRGNFSRVINLVF